MPIQVQSLEQFKELHSELMAIQVIIDGYGAKCPDKELLQDLQINTKKILADMQEIVRDYAFATHLREAHPKRPKS